MSQDDDNEIEDIVEAITEAEEAQPEKQPEVVEKAPSKEAKMTLEVAAVIPMHAVVGAKRGRGRPKKIQKAPKASDLVYHAEMQQAQQKFIDEDELVKAARENKGTAQDTLRTIKFKLARDLASLEFLRTEAEKLGKDTAQIISRRAALMKEIKDTELQLHNMGQDMIDLKSEKFQRIFKLWVEIIQDVVQEALTPEQADLFFNRLGQAMANWEERAGDVIR